MNLFEGKIKIKIFYIMSLLTLHCIFPISSASATYPPDRYKDKREMEVEAFPFFSLHKRDIIVHFVETFSVAIL